MPKYKGFFKTELTGIVYKVLNFSYQILKNIPVKRLKHNIYRYSPNGRYLILYQIAELYAVYITDICEVYSVYHNPSQHGFTYESATG